MASHSTTLRLRDIQERICQDLKSEGIYTECLNDNYIFVEYHEFERQTIRGICRAYNVRSVSVIEREGTQVWRIRLNQNAKLATQSERALQRIHKTQKDRTREVAERKPALVSPQIRIIVSGKRNMEIKQRNK